MLTWRIWISCPQLPQARFRARDLRPITVITRSRAVHQSRILMHTSDFSAGFDIILDITR